MERRVCSDVGAIARGIGGRSRSKEQRGEERQEEAPQNPKIATWVLEFSVYVGVMAKKHPERVPGLAAYMAQIVQASRQFRGNPWVEYDTRRRMQAAAAGHTNLAEVDTSLWAIAKSVGVARRWTMYQHSANKNHKTGTNPHHQRDGANRFATTSTGEIAGGRISPFVTSAADVREAIPTTNAPKAGDAGRQEARVPTPGPRSGRGAGLSEEERVRTTHKTLVIHAVVVVTRHRIVAAV